MPKLQRVLETVLYVSHLERATRFYADVLGLTSLYADQRMTAFDVNGAGVLLLFVEGQSLKRIEMPGGAIPPHDGSGPVHVAFSITAEDLRGWEEALASHGVAIESRATWPRGGVSIYFRDPDGHALELATPGLWQGY